MFVLMSHRENLEVFVGRGLDCGLGGVIDGGTLTQTLMQTLMMQTLMVILQKFAVKNYIACMWIMWVLFLLVVYQ